MLATKSSSPAHVGSMVSVKTVREAAADEQRDRMQQNVNHVIADRSRRRRRITTTTTTTTTAAALQINTNIILLVVSFIALLSYTYAEPSSSTISNSLSSRSLIRASTAKPITIALSGGLLHASGFFFNASVGGQHFTLQVDLTYSSLIIPYKTCEGCRIGDRRYDPAKSAGSGERILCGDRRCHSPLDADCHSMRCFNCSPRGRCCVERSSSGRPGSENGEGEDGCAFNVLYGDQSSGNGTLYSDRLKITGSNAGSPLTVEADLLFGAMHEESHNFELPYADGVFGLAFQKGACRPTCFPPLMDSFTNSTGLADVSTMCVSRYGGTLVLGAADTSLAQPGAQFAYVDLIPTPETPSPSAPSGTEGDTGNEAGSDDGGGEGDDKSGPSASGGRRLQSGVGAKFFFETKKEKEDEKIVRFMVPALPTWKVNDRDVSLPGINSVVLTAGLSDIAMSKTSLLALIEHLMTYHCDVPGLCSISSWFRPQHCVELSDDAVSLMPNITIPFTPRVSITLTADDYLIPYGDKLRCVAVVVSESLASKGIGVLLGSTVISRYAVVLDRAKRRLGVAPSAGVPKCGPERGSDVGLPRVPGNTGDLLTADAPAATVAPFSNTIPKYASDEENCRAISACRPCASNVNCSYSYDNGKCVPLADAGTQPYPYCTGAFCACFAVGKTGWYFGIILGVLCCLAFVFIALMWWRKRQQRNFYRSVNAYEEQDLETF